jgi:hypothetical protein
MRVAGSRSEYNPQGFYSKVNARGVPRRYLRRYGREREAVLILILFILLIVILLYFT